MKLHIVPALGVFTASLLSAAAARANCAMPVGYEVTVQGNTVTICPKDHEGRVCPDPGGLLRVEASSGAKVQVMSCGTGNSSTCYVDDCVPKGTYQYGYAKPFDCCASCCGTSYYEVATVAADPSGCTPTGTQPFTGNVPWTGKDQLICGYSGGGGAPGTGGAPTTGGAAGAPTTSGGGDDDGGCAVRGLGPAGAVVGFNAAVAALGLLLLSRRRRDEP